MNKKSIIDKNLNIEEFIFKYSDIESNDKFNIDSTKIEHVKSYDLSKEYEEKTLDLKLDQSNLNLLYLCEGNKNREALLVLNSILGGGIFSKLFKNK